MIVMIRLSAILDIGQEWPYDIQGRKEGFGTMSVSISLPDDLESALRSRVENLDRLALEALAVELYRRGEVTQFQFASLLGLTRFQADDVLKRHGVFYDLAVADVLGETRLGSEAAE